MFPHIGCGKPFWDVLQVEEMLFIVITSIDKEQQEMSFIHKQDIVVGLYSDLWVDGVALIFRINEF